MEIGVLELDSLKTGREWVPLIHRHPTYEECQFVDCSFWTVTLRQGHGATLSMRTYVRDYWVRIDKSSGDLVSDDAFHYWLLEDMYSFPEPPMVAPAGDNRDLSRRYPKLLSRGDTRGRRGETYDWARNFRDTDERYRRSLRELDAEMRALGHLARQNPTNLRVERPTPTFSGDFPRISP